MLIATVTPDTVVVLTVLRLGVVFVNHLHTRVSRVGTVKGDFVLGASVADPATVVAVVVACIVDSERSASNPSWTGVGAGSVSFAGTDHHVGVTAQHAVLGSVFHLYVVTAVHTNLVVGSVEITRSECRVVSSRCSSINIGAAGTDEVGDLAHRCVEEEAGAIHQTDTIFQVFGVQCASRVGNLIDGVFLGGTQRVDLALTIVVDAGIVQNQDLGTLDGHKVTAGLGEGLCLAARGNGRTVVADDDGAFVLTGIA